MRGNLRSEDLSLPDKFYQLDHFLPEHPCHHIVPVRRRLAWQDGFLHLRPPLVGSHGQKDIGGP